MKKTKYNRAYDNLRVWTQAAFNEKYFTTCGECGSKLFRSGKLNGYDTVNGKPDYTYYYACSKVCEEFLRYLKLPWKKRLFTFRPWHVLGVGYIPD